MSIEVAPGTPLAEALNSAILPKLVEAGWGTGGDEDGALAEYIILMLVNGKTQEQIAHELSSELLSLPPDDPAVLAFSQWLFETLAQLHSQLNGAQAPQGDAPVSEMRLTGISALARVVVQASLKLSRRYLIRG